MEPAVFIREETASMTMAGMLEGDKYRHGRTFPVVRRGQMLGYGVRLLKRRGGSVDLTEEMLETMQ